MKSGHEGQHPSEDRAMHMCLLGTQENYLVGLIMTPYDSYTDDIWMIHRWVGRKQTLIDKSVKRALLKSITDFGIFLLGTGTTDGPQ